MGQLQKVSWRAVGYTALGIVVAAASVVAVVNSDGVRPALLTSNAATRWLVDQANDTVVLVDGLAGHVVARIQTDSIAVGEVAVQGAGGAFLVAKGGGSLRTISTAKLQLGTAQAVSQLLDAKAQLGVGASGLTVLSAATGEASVVAVGDVTRPIDIPKSSTGSLVAADGSMWLLNSTEATHVNVDETSTTVELRSTPDQTVAIGAHAVSYDADNSTVRWLDGGDVSIGGAIPNASEAILQQSGDDASCVWVGAGNTLACVGATAVQRKVVIPGMNITSDDRLAVAGAAAVIVTRSNDVTRIDIAGQQLDTAADRPSVRDNATLAITASGSLIWLDDVAGHGAWVVHPFGINSINKNDDSAPLLDAQGQVTAQGDGGGGQSTGNGGTPGDDQADHLDNNGHDDPPVAVDDSVTARSGSTVIVPVTANDYDPDGDAIAVSSVGIAGNGTADVLDGTSVSYVPNAGFSGSDSFEYTIVDENGNPDTGKVDVHLFPPGTPNQPPMARSDAARTGIDRAVTIDVLANDIDPERDLLTVSSFRQEDGAKITETIGPSGLPALKFQPPPGKAGIFPFTYQAADPQGSTSVKTRVMVEVTNAANTAPKTKSDAIRLPVGVGKDLDVKANDVDPDGDEIVLVSVDKPQGVEAEVKGQHLFIRLGPGANPRSVVTYTINDGDATHNTIGKVLVLKIDSGAPNLPPVANPDRERVVIGNSVKIPVTANDVDPDLDKVRLVTVGKPSDGGGITTVEGDSVRFKPTLVDITEPTPVTFSYTITDGNGHEVTGRVTVTVLVEALPRAPFARDDFADTVKDKSVNIDVLANDSDPSGGKPSLIGTPVCANGGIASKTTDNRVTFDPPPGQTGTFRCNYTVSNTQGLLADASIIVTVTEAPAGNSAPQIVAARLQQSVNIGDSLAINANDIANDADKDLLVFTSVGTATRGSVTFTPGTSTFVYNAPVPGSADKTPGVITLGFTISDGHGGNVTESLSIKLVDPITTPESPIVKPVTGEIPVSALAGETVVVNVVKELADRNFGTTLTLTGATVDSGPGSAQVINGVASIATTGPGLVVVTYTVINTAAISASDKIRLTLTQPPQPQPPVAVDDFMTISSGGSNSVNLLANDSGFSDPGEKPTVELKNRPPASFGNVTLLNGLLTFVAAPQASGVVVLTYILRDGSGLLDEADVTLTLLPCSESPPLARSGTAFTPYQTPINIDLNQLVDSGNIIASSVSGAGLSGPTGVYTPPAGMNGNETVTFTVINGCKQTAQGQLTIDVNRPPVAGSVPRPVSAGGSADVAIAELASDQEPLTIVGLDANHPSWVTFDVSAVHITPPVSANGPYTIIATVRDPGGLTADAVINVNVANQPPTANPDDYNTKDTDYTFAPLVNDSDPENGALFIQTAQVTSNNGSAIIDYPNNHTNIRVLLGSGVTTLSYTIRDEGELTSNSTTITITLAPSNGAPVVPDNTGASVSGGQTSVHLTMVVFEPDGDHVDVRCVAPAGFIVLITADPSGTTDATHPSFNLDIGIPDSFSSPAIIRCTATDPYGASGTGNVTITRD
ncbi:MAG: Ig-like domain-containing protein [Ilumatobacteraceae bacterium]